MLTVFLDNLLLIQRLRIKSAKIGPLHISRWVLLAGVFKLKSVLIFFELLLAVHAHIGLALLPRSVQSSLIQELVDEIFPRILLARRNAILLIGWLLYLLGVTSLTMLVIGGIWVLITWSCCNRPGLWLHYWCWIELIESKSCCLNWTLLRCNQLGWVPILYSFSAHLSLLLQTHQDLLLPLVIKHALGHTYCTALTTSVGCLALTLLRNPVAHLWVATRNGTTHRL